MATPPVPSLVVAPPATDPHAPETSISQATTDTTVAAGETTTTPSAIPATKAAASTVHLRNSPLPLSEVPPHEALGNVGSSTINPATFAAGYLNAGLQFVDAVLPTFSVKKAAAASPPSAAKVECLVSSAKSKLEESWAARRSTHVDKAEKGTASWEEFDGGIRREHSVNEMGYTADIKDAWRVCGWEGLEGVEGWKDVGMEVYEMYHHLPAPLNPRAFSTLVITALSSTGEGVHPQIVVVQVPLSLSAAPAARYANASNTTSTSLPAHLRKKAVTGKYVSVERVMKEGKGEIVWEMATASDAGGMLPMAVQKMAVPGAVVKDVGFFMGYCDGRRGGPVSGGLSGGVGTGASYAG